MRALSIVLVIVVLGLTAAQAGEISLRIVNVVTPQDVKIWEPTTIVAKKGDTVVLQLVNRHADEHGFDPGRWTLLHGDDDAVRDLAAALGVAYRPDGEGGFDHAAVISLIDDKGEIVFQQRGTQASSDELLAKLNDLLKKRS